MFRRWLIVLGGGALFGLVAAVNAQVTVQQERDRVVLQNTALQVEISPVGGGRVSRLVPQDTGQDLIALWKGPQEIGGALDDRLFFTSARYDVAVMQSGPEVGVVRLEVRHPSGLGLVKTVTLERGQAALRVHYQFRNATQRPYRLWVRNFFVPDGPPLTEAHRYWLPLAGEPIIGKPFLHGYFSDLRAPWAALLSQRTETGLLTIVPGVEKFYFWQGSREFPTFEWLYPETPAGREMEASLALLLVRGRPDWAKLAQERLPRLRSLRFSPVPGWVDEATQFAVTPAERERGFWLSIGRPPGKQRLPLPLELDLPREEERAIYLGINTLREWSEVSVEASVNGALAGQVEPRWEVSGDTFAALEPLTADRRYTLTAGAEYHLWLLVRSSGLPPGRHEGRLRLRLGGAQGEVPLRVTVWDVRLPSPVAGARLRPFHVRGYGTIGTFAGGYEATPESVRQLDALYAAYAAIGGDVLDWTVHWAAVLPQVKIADRGEVLTQVARTSPERLPLNDLPPLDFRHFDPWLEVAKNYGVTRVETHLPFMGASATSWRLLDPAVGKGRAQPGSPEEEVVWEWMLRELRRYFAKHGFAGFFCKISDEISPEHIPAYIRSARVAQRAGWRPFTTITGLIPRTAEYINRMNPYCDEWQLSLGLKEDFWRLLRTRYRREQRRVELKGRWGAYRNGGARDTWAQPLFGVAIPEAREEVERLQVLEDGKPLRERGGSPWGNRERGVYFPLSQTLYLAASDGSNPNRGRHRYEVVYTRRVPDPQGKALAAIDPTDEVWFYGGRSKPFRTPYEEAAVYPLLAAALEVDGYGWWAFQSWQPTEKVVWYEREANQVRFGPTFLGLRDGYRDACLLWEAKRLLKEKPSPGGEKALRQAVSEGPEAALRLGERRREVYCYRTIVTANSPLAFNRARRALLRWLAGS